MSCCAASRRQQVSDVQLVKSSAAQRCGSRHENGTKPETYSEKRFWEPFWLNDDRLQRAIRNVWEQKTLASSFERARHRWSRRGGEGMGGLGHAYKRSMLRNPHYKLINQPTNQLRQRSEFKPWSRRRQCCTPLDLCQARAAVLAVNAALKRWRDQRDV